MDGMVLDAGAFLALERRNRDIIALIDRAKQFRLQLVTSAGVVGQVWCGSPRQASIAGMLKWDNMRVVDLTEDVGRTVGLMLAATSTSDVIDGHVALLARRRAWPVVTSDSGHLRKLDPTLTLWQV